MNYFTQQVVTIGRRNNKNVKMLGSGFFISENKVATTGHVAGKNDEGLVVLAPAINNINDYQDTSDNRCTPIQATIDAIDPIKDLAILQISGAFDAKLPPIGSFDELNISEEVVIFGFPHCIEGRRVLTYQKAELGAKIRLSYSGIKTKYGVINIQARPGQSGSLVFSWRLNKIIGILVGAYAPDGASISISGINPRELHQTTHCISAEYLKEML